MFWGRLNLEKFGRQGGFSQRSKKDARVLGDELCLALEEEKTNSSEGLAKVFLKV